MQIGKAVHGSHVGCPFDGRSDPAPGRRGFRPHAGVHGSFDRAPQRAGWSWRARGAPSFRPRAGARGVSRGQPLDQAAHERLACVELADGKELVGLVRLLDRAGAADHHGIARILEEAGLGALPDRPGENQIAAQTGPAATLMGWRATTSLESGLRQTADWHRAQLVTC